MLSRTTCVNFRTDFNLVLCFDDAELAQALRPTHEWEVRQEGEVCCYSPSWTMTSVPTGTIWLNPLAADMGMRTQPWLAG